MERFAGRWRSTEPEFRALLERIPLLATPPLPPEWLRCEMLERHELLRRASVSAGAMVLEVGTGGHAISTVPLAHAVGREGRVLAVERSRWGQFREIVAASGLGGTIAPVTADAGHLPFRDSAVDLAVCLHGLRSLRGEENTVRVCREMLRTAPRILLAESLPIGRTPAQRAHLAMYDLREGVFAATLGAPDDLHYRPLDALESLVERAGGRVEWSETVEVDLPHFLAYFPRRLVERIPEERTRTDLLRRWDDADVMLKKHGEDHPPVGLIGASRAVQS